MKILSIIVDLNKGGAEINFFRLNSFLNDQGYKILVICLTKSGYFSKKFENLNIEVIHLDIGFNLKIFSKLLLLNKIIKQFNPNQVHTWMYHSNVIGGLLAKINGVKKIIWNIRHGNYKLGSTKITTIFFIFLNSFFSYFIPNKIIFNSNSSKIFHNKIFFKNRSSYVIYNGIDTNFFYPFNKNISLFNELNLNKNVFLIGMFARSSPQKDHITLIKSIDILIKEKKYKDIHCLLVGKSIPKNELIINTIQKLNLTKYFTLLDHEDNLVDFYNLLDIHILCSNYGESFSNSLLEAMSCGIPSISTDAGDVSNLIIDKKLICKIKNINQIISSIIYLKKMKENNNNWVYLKKNIRTNVTTKFHQEIMFKKFKELIDEH